MDDLPVEVQLKEAVRAVEACIAGDIDALSGRAQQEAVVALQRLQSLVSAAHAKAVSPWDASAVWADDRSRSGPARLARDAACAPASARRVVRRARALRSMPLTRAAFEDGSLSADHVDVLCRANHAPLEALFARDEAVLVGHARTMHYDDLVRLVDHWR
ncbi:MAG TPA: hypothetical protein VHK88_14395, partial [Aquihabitans sp.]|nr:hypothetical protein [Aquihabitans sp.]